MVPVTMYHWMLLTWKNQIIRLKTCPSGTFSTTNPTRTHLELNAFLRIEREVTDHLNHSISLVKLRPLVTYMTWWIKCNGFRSVGLRVVICIRYINKSTQIYQITGYSITFTLLHVSTVYIHPQWDVNTREYTTLIHNIFHVYCIKPNRV
jgi:uncharacterized membrane protein YecN with MAPEG domain